MSPPLVLTIAGSDSSAGAGVQADLKAISAHGGYALTALTSVVSETPGAVSQIRLLDPAIIHDQMRVLLARFPVRAAKSGMLGGRAQAEAVVQGWRESAGQIPLVADPVMVATGGGSLMAEDAIEWIAKEWLPLARVVTPNMDEAAVLWRRPVTSRQEMADCAEALADRFQTAVLVKGGHLIDSAEDVLCSEEGLRWFEGARVAGVKTHGTGCTYSASIAALLAQGCALIDAVAQAKRYIGKAIAQHFSWTGETGNVQALNHLALTP